MVRGIVFDLDGVITETSKYHFLAWAQLGREIGVEINQDINKRLKGVNRRDSLSIILEYSDTGQNISEDKKIELMERKNRYYQEYINNINHKNINPGVIEFLNDVSSRGINLAVASSSENAPIIINKLGINNYFKGIVNPKGLRGKPDAQIFEKGIEILGFSPKDCVGIEDSVAGIQSINAAGLFPVGIGDKKELKGAKYVFQDTRLLNFNIIYNEWRNSSSQ